MKNIKFISFILLSVIILSLSSCSVLDNKDKADKGEMNKDEYIYTDNIIAEIEGEKITKSELKFIFDHIRNTLEENANLLQADTEQIKTFWETEIEGEQRVDVVKRESLEDLIEVKLLVSKAKEDNVQLDETDNAEIDELMELYIETNGGEDLAEINLQKSFGMSLEEYKKINKELVLSSKYKNQAYIKFEIAQEDIKKYYEDSIDSLEMVSMKYILILTETYEDEEPMTDDEIADKRKIAEEVLDMAENGEDFDVLTEEYTEDPEYRLYGNELTFSRENVRDDLKEWAFSEEVGKLTILEVPAGFMVLKIIEKHDFEYVAEEIKQTLQKQEFEKKLEQWKEQDFIINQELIDSIDMFKQ